jgi:hypothetical protein
LSKTEKSEGKEGQEKQSSKPGDADGSLNATKTLFLTLKNILHPPKRLNMQNLQLRAVYITKLLKNRNGE